MSLEFDYYDLALSLSMNPASFCGRDEDFEFNFNLYGRKFSLDFCYQMAKTAAGNVGRGSFAANVERGWLASPIRAAAS